MVSIKILFKEKIIIVLNIGGICICNSELLI